MNLSTFFDNLFNNAGNLFGLSAFVPPVFIGLASFVIIYLIVKTFREFL